MSIINLTPHIINFIIEKDGSVIEKSISPDGVVARVGEVTEMCGEHDGIPLFRKRYGETENLPEPVDGVFYIVSTMVRLANPERCDLVSPSDLVRDENGVIVGCKGLVINF